MFYYFMLFHNKTQKRNVNKTFCWCFAPGFSLKKKIQCRKLTSRTILKMKTVVHSRPSNAKQETSCFSFNDFKNIFFVQSMHFQHFVKWNFVCVPSLLLLIINIFGLIYKKTTQNYKSIFLTKVCFLLIKHFSDWKSVSCVH